MGEQCIFMNLVGVAGILLLLFFCLFQLFSLGIRRVEMKCVWGIALAARPHLHLPMNSTGTALLNLLLEMKLPTNGTCCTSFYSASQDSGVIKNREKNTEVIGNRECVGKGKPLSLNLYWDMHVQVPWHFNKCIQRHKLALGKKRIIWKVVRGYINMKHIFRYTECLSNRNVHGFQCLVMPHSDFDVHVTAVRGL